MNLTEIYHLDFYAWVLHNVDLLHHGNIAQADIAHIIEELMNMSKSERRALENFIRNILLHLLKWQFQSGLRSNSWRQSIRNGRREVGKIIKDSPSLSVKLPHIFVEEYLAARDDAADETGLPISTFPTCCPYSLNQIMDTGFFPE